MVEAVGWIIDMIAEVFENDRLLQMLLLLLLKENDLICGRIVRNRTAIDVYLKSTDGDGKVPYMPRCRTPVLHKDGSAKQQQLNNAGNSRPEI